MKAIIYSLLVIMTAVLLILILPLRFIAEYDRAGGLTVKLNLLLFKIKVFSLPAEGEKKRKKDNSGKDKNREKDARKKDRKDAAGRAQISFSFVKKAVSEANGIVKKILASFVIRDLSFTIPVYDPDPYALHKKYGLVTSAFYSMNTVLQQNVRVYYRSPLFIADFNNRYKDSVYFYCRVAVSPCMAIGRALYAYKKYINLKKEMVQNSRKEI